MEGVISVFRSKTMQLHTTRSWDFLGLPMISSTGTASEAASPLQLAYGQDVIVGVFDTGIWPESESFREEPHMRPIPSTWKGECVKGEIGHARGGAPKARLAVYKVCWGNNYSSRCTGADILAAFDDALHDGVQVISASVGSRPPLIPLFASEGAIGSFHAMQLGVSVVFSAGNEGPDPSQVTNVAPWSLCVAASSIDRMFPTRVLLDNKLSIMGESLFTTPIKAKLADASVYFYNGICTSRNWIKSK
ncbi:hypothetical protein ACLB2K_030588 [Fragaria x ananassa]